MSFRATLSNFWNNVQCTLFPELELVCGELSPDYKKLISILELVRIEQFLPCTRFNYGRPSKNAAFIARAFIAKIVFKITHTKQLIQQLESDKQLKIICGWDVISKIPSKATFSRAFANFAETSLPERVHEALIKGVYKNKVVGHVVKDSMPLVAREKHVQKGSAKDRKKLRDKARRDRIKSGEPTLRQKQFEENNLDVLLGNLPISCDKGMKRSAKGYTTIWNGYKLHAAVDDYCIPLAVIVTSASLNDSTAAIPLAKKTEKVAINLYDLMDAAYDHPEIKAHSLSMGHIPIIDQCPKNKAEKAEKLAEKERRKTLNLKTAEDRRYKNRFPKERFNALYKDFHGGNSIFVKGYQKVSCHVMFGVLAYTAATLINLIQ